ncbi:MAG: hypothetical protein ACRCXL_00220 [Dermatophilaceae bacterium]
MSVRDVMWAVFGAAVVGLGTGALGLLGIVAGSSSLSVGWSVTGRTVLTLAGLALIALLMARRGPWEQAAPVVAVAAVGMTLDPLTWTAEATAGGPLLGIHLTGSSPVGLALDAVVWLGVATGAAVAGVRSRDMGSVEPSRSPAGRRSLVH